MRKRTVRMKSNSTIGAAITLLSLSFCPSKSLAENNFLKMGMAEFNAGNYSDASGHFGAALSTDFNSSVLHYYLGNCYVHMKQKEAAIREFRIAYALDPEKDVGKYAKQVLLGLGADAGGPGAVVTPGAAPNPSADAQAKAAVEKLLDLKNKPGGLTPVGPGGSGSGLPVSNGLPPNGSGMPPMGLPPGVDASKLIGIPGTKYDVGRGGRLFEPTPAVVPTTAADTASRLEALRRMYEGNRYVPTTKTNQEIQKTAENLRELMAQQAKPGRHHLVPAGTNLYIRNYQMTPGQSTQSAPNSVQTTPSSSSGSSTSATTTKQAK
jgi:tetratricopeptide (TPR) repeat protein